MKRSYVTLLTADAYLPGVATLYQSLVDIGAAAHLLVLVSGNVSATGLACLQELGIAVKRVEPVTNPFISGKRHRFRDTYTKLQAFALVEFEKIVYLDADMLACDNIDELFDKSGWSAVNAGGMLPEHQDWKELNSGLLVIEPNLTVFADMMHCKDILPSKDWGDQGFLQAYFPQWVDKPELHLDHGFNMYYQHVERYQELYGYQFPGGLYGKHRNRIIRVLHYWGSPKPWQGKNASLNANSYSQAIDLWWHCFESLQRRVAGNAHSSPELKSFLNRIHANRPVFRKEVPAETARE